ncbi:MAG: N-acetylmuramoyl-L-alanine amidase [Clostridiales bacterium]|nr:N-acetylmuramoyl-L-alanine amidase [Clostridiales bacterium]
MKFFNSQKSGEKLVIACFSAVFFLTAILTYLSIADLKQTSHSNVYTVVIDAGHGGIDGGVTGKTTGVKESDLNLEIAKKLKNMFSSAGIKAVMTRTGYGGLYGTTAKGFKMRDMKARVKIINSANAQAFVSIHLNYYSDGSRRGATVFFGEDEQGRILAEKVQDFFNRSPCQPRKFSALKGDYYLLNEANCPAIICECGFLSNAEDEKLLIKQEYQEKIANMIFQGVISYLSAFSKG